MAVEFPILIETGYRYAGMKPEVSPDCSGSDDRMFLVGSAASRRSGGLAARFGEARKFFE